MKDYFWKYTFIFLALSVISCTEQKKNGNSDNYVAGTIIEQPEWSKNALIYEVNIRQHTAEGTINAFSKDIPRLKEMGVDILWLMPIFPIGEKFRKATQTQLIEEIEDPAEREKYLGSYYSIRDYKAVNPDLGTLDELKALVNKAHDLGMYVILDIAANHTAWDHEWITNHPDYYSRIDSSNPPWNPEWVEQHPAFYEQLKIWGMTYPDPDNETDWWDTADLNYGNEDMRKEMIEAFTYWVSEVGVDGYRCDVAGRVPCDFWNETRLALDKIKPVFMLAEDEYNYCLYEKAFNMNYGWELHHRMNEIAEGHITADDLKAHFERRDTIFDPAIYQMNFITNHDENSWNGTVFERMGDAVEVFALLSFTVPGMPLIYSGQEMGLNKRLTFFTKDTIHWTENKWEGYYKDLIRIKKDHKALWNGSYGGRMEILKTETEGIFAFKRVADESEVLVITNLSNTAKQVNLDIVIQKYSSLLGNTGRELSQDFVLEAYDYMLLVKND